MSSPAAPGNKEVSRRADELLAENLFRIHSETDRAFSFLLVAQWIAGIAIACWLSPRTWIGETSQIHVHVWAAVVLGGVITLPAAACGFFASGRTLTRHLVAVAQMIDSALLIHLTGGRIETHFHVFGSLAFLAFYRDWRVMLSATIVVALDHFWRGVYWPQSVFGVLTASHWRWMEHAWWVVFEDFFLLLGMRRAMILLREVAQHRAELEFSKERVEQAVLERTAELAAANRELEDRIVHQQRIEKELEMAVGAADTANRAKSQFLANMSHEVRTPINGIMGLNSLMLQTSLTSEQHEYATTIRDCSHKLLDLVNDVLDFSEIETGGARLHEHPVMVDTWLSETIELHRASAEAKGLRLERAVEGFVPAWIVADGGRLSQILSNLLHNAVKFTDQGAITVVLRSRPVEPPAGAIVTDPWYELTFAVRDTGIGIPEDHIGSLFKQFSQVDASMSRRHGGMGLGLVVAGRLAQMLGGGIQLESSKVGEGSTFTVTIRARAKIPAHASVPPAAAFGPPSAEPATSRASVSPAAAAGTTAEAFPQLAPEKPLRILLAEDNVVNQRVATQLLKRLGYACDIAGNGREAIEALERQGYDLILMDVQMPELDGLAATREILRRWSSSERPEIVAVTAHAGVQDREACLAAGMDDFLTKPIVPAVLADKIREAADRRDSRLAAAAR